MMPQKLLYPLIGLLLAALPMHSRAQNLSTSLERLYQIVSSSNSFATSMSINVQDIDGASVERTNAQIKKSGNAYYYELGDFTMLYGKRGLLAIDHAAQEMFYTQHTGAMPIELPGLSLPNFDSIADLSDSVRYHHVANGTPYYVLYNANAEMTQTHLYFDAETGFYNKVVYFYHHPSNPNPYTATVSFTNTELNTGIAASEFSEKKYIVARNRTWMPADAYAHYSLIINDFYDED